MSVPQVRVGIDISAPPQRVWDVVSDVTLMPQWSAELQSVHWAEGFDRAAPGAKFVGRNRHPSVGEWQTLSEIVAFDPPRTFGWAVGPPENAAATWTFELRPTGAGTRLDYVARIGPGPSGVTMLISREPDRAEAIVSGRLAEFRTAMAATLDGIRRCAESDCGTG